MSAQTSFTPTIQRLSERVSEDIVRRGLRDGDLYRSSAETAKMLGVSRSTAHRVMNLLAEQGYLVRRHGAGTVVGRRVRGPERSPIRCVHLVVPRSDGRIAIPLDNFLNGIHRALPDASTQINRFPKEDPLPLFRQLLSETTPLGIGLILAPREIQAMVSESGVPTVVLGRVYPGIQGLASFDLDYLEVGRLLADYLLDHGHKKFAMLVREHIAPGEADRLRGFAERLGEAGLPSGSMRVVYGSQSQDVIAFQVRELLSEPNSPTALVGHPYAPVDAGVAEATEEAGLIDGKDFEYIHDLMATSPPTARCPVRPVLGPGGLGLEFGQSLARESLGDQVNTESWLIPVELDPDYSGQTTESPLAPRAPED